METPTQSLEALLVAARERKRTYVATAPAVLSATRAAVDLLLEAIKQDQPLDAARAALAAVHLQLLPTQLAGAPALAVVEEPTHRTGRGIFVWRCGALGEERIVQVPHSFFDEDTLAIGMAAAAAGARALFVNSVHRYPGGMAPKQASGEEEAGDASATGSSPSDLAHQTETTWQVMTLAAVRHFPPVIVLQVHGFADRSDPAHAEAGMVVSPSVVKAGKEAAAQLVTRLAHALPGVGVCLYPRDTRVLGGTKNAQAKLLAANAPALFLHVELARTLRRRLANDTALRDAFVNAVWGRASR
jgi:hypothetical protein